MKRFTAHFDADCDWCDELVEEGDIKYRTDGGEYICEPCKEGKDDE